MSDRPYRWKLMSDQAVTTADRSALARFIEETSWLTSGPKVREFEQAFSDWQGCEHSVFVNSGSSANLILLDAARQRYGSGPVVCQAITWSTNVAPAHQLGLKVQLCDIAPDNFGPDLKNLEWIFENVRPRFLFLTHVLGFPAISSELLDLCAKYDVRLLEDCCEAHGATSHGRKVGKFGIGATFSFYFGHHMTTIEGGMVCTDDETLYHRLLLLRSHGLLRALPRDARTKDLAPGVDERFAFLTFGYNMKNTEMQALLGIRQLQRLDGYIQIRNENLKTFLALLDPAKYKTDYALDGVSSFALPILVQNNRDDVLAALEENGIESRPVIAGNLYNHPAFENIEQYRFDDNAQRVNRTGLYVGNHQEVTPEQVRQLADLLNQL